MNRMRSSNFEALRLFAMVCIVTHHYASVTPWDWNRERETYSWLNEFVINCMSTTGKIGVDVFLLLTGYFLSGKGMKPSSIARTWFEAVNWSHILFIPAWYFNAVEPHQYKLALSPVIARGYWFIGAYVVSSCCSGWVAGIVQWCSTAQLAAGVLAQFLVMSCFWWPLEVSVSNPQWFLFVMVLGCYIRKHISMFQRIGSWWLISVIVINTIVNIGSIYYFTFYDVKWAKDRHGPNALARENWSIVSLVYGIALFLLFERMNIQSTTVNLLAKLTLGVYLLHENTFVQPRIWAKWVNAYQFQDSPILPIVAPIEVAGVYTICSVLEYIRQLVFGWLQEYVAWNVGAVVERLADYLNENVVTEKEEAV